MHRALRRTITLSEFLQGQLFIFLNIADAWLTEQIIASGGGEANPIVSIYGGSLAIKALLALAVVSILAATGKMRLLKPLNLGMSTVVLWTGGWLLTYL